MKLKKNIVVTILFTLCCQSVIWAQLLNANIGFELDNWESEWRINNYGDSTSKTMIVSHPHPVRAGSKSIYITAKEDYRNEIIFTKSKDTDRFSYDKEYWFGASFYLVNYTSPPLPSWSTIIQLHGVPGKFNWDCCAGRNGWTLRTIYDELVIYSTVLDPYTIPSCAASGNAASSWRKPLTDYENRWVDVVINFRLSTNNSGYIKWWIDGELVVDISGPNVNYYDVCGIPREPFCYIQTGIYKERSRSDVSRTLYLDEIRIGNSKVNFDDVSPRGIIKEGKNVLSKYPEIKVAGNKPIHEGDKLKIFLHIQNNNDGQGFFALEHQIDFISVLNENNGFATLLINPEMGDAGKYKADIVFHDNENGIESKKSLSIKILSAEKK